MEKSVFIQCQELHKLVRLNILFLRWVLRIKTSKSNRWFALQSSGVYANKNQLLLTAKSLNFWSLFGSHATTTCPFIFVFVNFLSHNRSLALLLCIKCILMEKGNWYQYYFACTKEHNRNHVLLLHVPSKLAEIYMWPWPSVSNYAWQVTLLTANFCRRPLQKMCFEKSWYLTNVKSPCLFISSACTLAYTWVAPEHCLLLSANKTNFVDAIQSGNDKQILQK